MRKLLILFAICTGALHSPAKASPATVWNGLFSTCISASVVTITTSAGADILFLSIATNGGGTPTISSDTVGGLASGNVWNAVANPSTTSIMYYTIPATVGLAEVITLAANGASGVSVCAMGFSGALQTVGTVVGSTPTNAFANPTTTSAPPAITDTHNDVLYVSTADANGSASPTVSGMSLGANASDGGTHQAVGIAYLVVATPTSTQPTWTGPGGSWMGSTLASFCGTASACGGVSGAITRRFIGMGR